MIVLVLLLILVWAIGAGVTVAFNQPQDAWEGALVLLAAIFIWPLLALGWLVSRPWA